jgi:hypothetical protein
MAALSARATNCRYWALVARPAGVWFVAATFLVACKDHAEVDNSVATVAPSESHHRQLNVANSLEEALKRIELFSGDPKDFMLPIARAVLDPEGVHMAIITHKIFEKKFRVEGSDRGFVLKTLAVRVECSGDIAISPGQEPYGPLPIETTYVAQVEGCGQGPSE